MKTYIVINDTTDEIGIGSMLSLAVAKNEQTLLAEGQKIANERNARGGVGVWSARVVDTSELPGDDPNSFNKLFRGAYTDKMVGNQIDIDVDKAKLIAHEMVDTKLSLPDRAAVKIGVDGANNESELRSILSDAGII